jgi:long-subunit acyl-CoA synthetase (AMP-forming)
MVIHQFFGLNGIYELTTADIHLSYLPIAHSFERFNTWACIYYGANIRYAKYPPN